MTISITDLEKNSIMSEYSRNVELDELPCVMLELDRATVVAARELAEKLNDLYFKMGIPDKNQNGYCHEFSILTEVLDSQMDVIASSGDHDESVFMRMKKEMMAEYSDQTLEEYEDVQPMHPPSPGGMTEKDYQSL